jgi:MFS family permease
LSFYGIAVAHMADRAKPTALTRCTSGLLFVWAGGAIVGPPLMGLAAELAGGAGLFFFASIGAFACASYMLLRRRFRDAPSVRRADAAPNQATSVAASGLALRDGEQGGGRPSPSAGEPSKP